MQAIELSQIRFSYDDLPVLDGADFVVADGERVGLSGANGSGKSTLFQILMGLLPSVSGGIRVYGNECRTEKDFVLARRQLGLLFQDPNDQLFSPTVAEDIAFGPLNLGKTHQQAQAIVARALEQVGLSGYGDRISYKLSAGEKHLVAMASVLAMEPRMLLLDEPMAALDEAATDRLVRILEGLSIGYVIISHNRAILEKTTDRLMFLQQGKITLK